jgi:undecaprenyl-diphosphatase
MIETLQTVDTAILLFVNRTLSTPLGDILWPLITDYDKQWPVRIVLLCVWLWLLVKGGVRGRTAALLTIPVLFAADKLSSEVIKELVSRPRPCHAIDGVVVVEGLRLLVDCGPGKSFPSSHAVNNFAVATVFARYFPGATIPLYCWAGLVALSRVAVGVHFPSDAVGGAVVGTLVALALCAVWETGKARLRRDGRNRGIAEKES